MNSLIVIDSWLIGELVREARFALDLDVIEGRMRNRYTEKEEITVPNLAIDWLMQN